MWKEARALIGQGSREAWGSHGAPRLGFVPWSARSPRRVLSVATQWSHSLPPAQVVQDQEAKPATASFAQPTAGAAYSEHVIFSDDLDVA
jgi:hypothetical protein